MIKTATKLFRVKRINMDFNIEWKGNPLVIHLPDGMGILEDDGNVFPIEKITILFHKIQNQVVFNVEVDGYLYIDRNYQLVDDDTKAADFGKDAKNKKGEVVKPYDSIISRAMAVCSAICEGKIKLGKMKGENDEQTN